MRQRGKSVFTFVILGITVSYVRNYSGAKQKSAVGYLTKVKRA
jgi:hypothetical protein